MYSIYEVRNNETIYDIAKNLNMTVEQLIKINDELNNIKEGQLIIVPNQNNYIMYTVKKGDTLSALAKRNDIDVKSIVLFNGLKEDEFLYPNQQLMIPKDNIYITNENENLFDIINKLNISLEEFLNLNDKIYLQKEQILFYKKD